eukprot:7649899-Ditylum_brightwellii.AAC.1
MSSWNIEVINMLSSISKFEETMIRIDYDISASCVGSDSTVSTCCVANDAVYGGHDMFSTRHKHCPKYHMVRGI